MLTLRRRTLLVLTAAVLGSGFGCSNLLGPSGKAEYSITGTATRVNVTYSSGGGGSSQVSNMTLPWTYPLSDLKKDDFLYVSAQIANTSGGSITVSITKDGKPFQTGYASGFAAIATASGSY